MRTLSATLEAAQIIGTRPLVRVVLTKSGATTYTYTLSDSPQRLYKITPHTESPWSQTATIYLSNHDGALTDVNFMGYQAVISYGFTGSSGAEYSGTALLNVIDSTTGSYYGQLSVKLYCDGIPNDMNRDRASADWAY